MRRIRQWAAGLTAAVMLAGGAAAQPVEGFGEGVPLAVAVSQIVPPQTPVSYGAGIDRQAPVSWRGGDDWRQVLRRAVKGHAQVVIRDDGSVHLAEPQPVKEWVARTSDRYLSTVLARWAAAEKWSFRYDVYDAQGRRIEYPIQSGVRLQAADLPAAVAMLVERGFPRPEPAFLVHAFEANKTLWLCAESDARCRQAGGEER